MERRICFDADRTHALRPSTRSLRSLAQVEGWVRAFRKFLILSKRPKGARRRTHGALSHHYRAYLPRFDSPVSKPQEIERSKKGAEPTRKYPRRNHGIATIQSNCRRIPRVKSAPWKTASPVVFQPPQSGHSPRPLPLTAPEIPPSGAVSFLALGGFPGASMASCRPRGANSGVHSLHRLQRPRSRLPARRAIGVRGARFRA